MEDVWKPIWTKVTIPTEHFQIDHEVMNFSPSSSCFLQSNTCHPSVLLISTFEKISKRVNM